MRTHVDRLPKLADALAKRSRQLGQALGAQHHQGNRTQKEKMYGTLDSHNLRLARRRDLQGACMFE